LAAEGTPEELKRIVPGGHVRLRFTDPTTYRTAATALRDATLPHSQLPSSGGTPIDDALTLHIPSNGTQRELRSLLDWLDAAGVEADELTLHTPDLDDVFFALTATTAVPHQTQETVR
ncbi:ABC transporter, partial [Streptomyces pharetrae CZA14]